MNYSKRVDASLLISPTRSAASVYVDRNPVPLSPTRVRTTFTFSSRRLRPKTRYAPILLTVENSLGRDSREITLETRDEEEEEEKEEKETGKEKGEKKEGGKRGMEEGKGNGEGKGEDHRRGEGIDGGGKRKMDASRSPGLPYKVRPNEGGGSENTKGVPSICG